MVHWRCVSNERALLGRTRRARRLALVVATLLTLLTVAPSSAVEVAVLFDLDDNAATGCSVATVDGAFAGVEQRLIAEVAPGPMPQVQSLSVATCTNPGSNTFAAPVPVTSPPFNGAFTPPWPVGVALGVDGSDVIELYLPVPSSVQSRIRVGVTAGDQASDGDALLTTDGTRTGEDIIVALPGAIPTLGDWGRIFLIVLLGSAAFLVLRRWPGTAAGVLLLLMVTAFAASALALILLDGDPGDWAPAAPTATDVVEVGPRPDIEALFARFEGSVFLRVDASLNTPPDARDDSFSTDEDTAIVEDVTVDNGDGADSDADLDPLSVTRVNGAVFTPGSPFALPSGALLTMATSGAFTWDPNGAFDALQIPGTTTDSYTYTVDDGKGGTDTATVDITITAVNDPPIVSPATFSVDEGVLHATVVGTVTITDPDDTTFAVAITAGNVGTTFSIDNGGVLRVENPPGTDFETTPTFSLTVEATDPGTSTGSATVTVNVNDLNEPPTVVDQTFSIAENSADATVVGTVAASDPDLPAQTLDYQISGGNTGGAFALDAMTGQITVASSAALDFETTPQFVLSVVVTDDGGPPLSDTATVTIDLLDANEPPTAVDDAAAQGAATDEDNPVTIDVLANDLDPDTPETLTVIAVGGSPVGMVTITNAGADVTYDPNGQFDSLPAGDTATDTFTYTIQDAGGLPVGGSTATVTVTITGVNDPPMLTADPVTYQTVGNTELFAAQTGSGIAFVEDATGLLGKSSPTDPDGLSFTVLPETKATTNGQVTISGDGSFTYRPNVGAVADSFTFTVRDDALAPVIGTANLSFVGEVWYVDSSVAGPGTGTSSDPFDSPTPLNGAGGAGDPDGAGDTLYFVQGDGTPYTDEIELEPNQQLIGKGVELVVAALTLASADVTMKPVFDTPAASGDDCVIVPVGASATVIAGVTFDGCDRHAIRAVDSAGSLTLDTVTVQNTSQFGLFVDGNGDDVGLDETTLDLTLTGTAFANNGSGPLVGGAIHLEDNGSAADPAVQLFDDTSVHGMQGFGLDVDGVVGSLTWSDTAGGIASAIAMNGGRPFGLTNVDGAFDLGAIPVSGDDTLGQLFGVLIGGTSATSAVTLGVVTLDGTSVANTFTGPAFSISSSSGTVTLDTLTLDGPNSGVGFSVASSDGPVSVLNPASSIQNAVGNAFDVDMGAGDILYAGSIVNGAFRAVEITNHAGPSTITFLGDVTDTASSGGVLLDNNDQGAGDTSIMFAGTLSLSTADSDAFVATNGGVVDVPNPVAANAVATTTGRGIDILDTAIGGSGVSFTSVNVGAAPSGIRLGNVGSGAFTASGGAINGVTDRGVDVLGGTGDVTIGAAITGASTARTVEVTSHTGGTVAFSGAVDENGLGVFLDNNGGSTLSFTGGLDLDSAAGQNAFAATNSGTLTVTGTNTADAGAGGTAVNLTNTTIGGTGVTFRSLSSTGANSGLILNTTGSTGTFTLTGDGSLARNGSGGSILNSTGHGVRLDNANGVVLQSLTIDGIATAGAHGIYSTGGSGFRFSGLGVRNITGGLGGAVPTCAVGAVRSSGWRGANLGGVNRIDNDSRFENFGPNADAGIDLRNCTANMTSLTIDDSDFLTQDANNGKTVVFVEASGSVNMGTVAVQNGGLFSGLRGNALQTSTLGTSTMVTSITGVDFRDAVTAGLGGIGGVAATASDSSNHTITISDNDFDDVQIAGGNAGTLAVTAFNTSSLTAVIANNRFTDLDGDGDVILNAQAIRAVSEQTGGGAVDVTISNNTVQDVGRQAVFVSGRNSAPDFDVRIEDNSIGTVSPVGFTNRDAIEVLAEDDANVDVLIQGNVVVVSASTQEALNLVTDRISVGNTPVLNATIGGTLADSNTFTNAALGAADNVVLETLDAGETLCVNMSGNTLAGTVTTIDLTSFGGTYGVTQASSPALSAANGGATVNVTGAVTFGQPACPTPSF